MRGKLLFITGGLIGYVLGARAGRKRYEQIASTANSVWNAEPVQKKVSEVRGFALELVGDVPAVLRDAGKKVVNKATSPKEPGARGSKTSPMPPTSFPTGQFPPDEADQPSTN